ncbi:MAG TPA: sugar phosphate isomerase/epimerase family protein [Tepidisphaeraceae bacterium]|jgi:sugar phosphate isomerase/epimerase
MPLHSPEFSVSEFTTWHQSFEEDVALYRELGVDGIEVCERKLSDDPGRAREQLQELKRMGQGGQGRLKVTSVQPRVHALFCDFMCPDVQEPEARLARYRQSIDLFSPVFAGENLPMVTIGGNAPGSNFRLAHETARALYPKLADYAAERGMRIMFEPLNPILMNNDTFICTLDDAMRLIDDVGRDNFGLMLDLWHIFREPNIAERIANLGDRIFAVHISDYPKEEVRHPADRLIPGTGVIDLPKLLGAIERTGYRGAYCLEIFSADHLAGSLWQADAREVIVQSREGFRRAWDARTPG